MGSALMCAAQLSAQNAVSTLAGSGSSGATNGTGTAASFSFTNPSGAAADAAGNLYVADALNHLIRKVTPAGVVTTFAGAGVQGSANGTGTGASFNRPQGIVIDGAGNLYVADSGNHTIRMITSGGVVTTLAGTVLIPGRLDATGLAATFNTPLGIACDRTGTGGAAANLYIADAQNNSIRLYVVATGAVTTLTGSATGANGNANGVGTAATFFHPDAIVANTAGTILYVADTFNHLIRQIAITAGPVATVTTLAGSGSAASVDGTGTGASFSGPAGIALDTSGNILVAGTNSHTIRSVTTAGVVTTIAGSANSSGTTDGLSTSGAKFNFPSGIASYSGGLGPVICVVDTNNQKIRTMSPAVAPSINAQPANVTTNANTNVTFTVAALGNPTVSYQWQIQPAGTFTFFNVSPGSTYTGSTTATLSVNLVTQIMSGDKFQCVVSNGFGTAATSSAATLIVNQTPVFTSASNASFTVGQAGSFIVTATGSPAPALSYSGNFPFWAGFNTATGEISGFPSNASGSPFTFTLTATSTAGTVNQTFTLTVLTGPTISSQPSTQTVSPGTTAQFTVLATNNGGTLTYQWQKQSAGTFGFFNIFDNGVTYFGTTGPTLTVSNTSPSVSGDQFQVVVSSGVGSPATSNPATLTVTQAPQITSLGSATFVENQYGTFNILATGSPSTITYSVISGFLPSGLLLNSSTGVIYGTPSPGVSASSPFYVQVSASNGVLPSATQTLSLVVSPTALVPNFTIQPVNQTVALGQTAIFTVEVTGTPTPVIQWQRLQAGGAFFVDLFTDLNFSGVNSTTLTVTNPSSGMSGDVFRAVATNNIGSLTSSTASISIVVGTTIATIAGQAPFSGSADGVGTAARFNGPSSVGVDPSGNLYIADTSNHVIRRVTSAGVVTTLAGSPGVSGSADGVGTAARFNAPSGIAVSNVGTVYVADSYNHTIRVVSSSGVVTTLAGLAGSTGSLDGTGSAARFFYPYGVAVDVAGTVYVADTFNHTIRRITSGGIVTTYAGAAGIRGTSNSFGTNSRFAFPFALAVDSGGTVYVADSYNHAIRRIDTATNVSTLAGNIGLAGSADGIGTAAFFNQPSGIAVDATGNIYVADTYSSTLRRVSPGGVVTTLAGMAGTTGSTDGVGTAARFNQPFGVAVDAAGNLFIADTRNNAIRRSGNVSAPTIITHPQSTGAAVGGSATFTVAATGSPTPTVFSWMRQPAGSFGFTTLFDDGIFSGTNTATLTITGATSAMNGDQFQAIVSNLISPNPTSLSATLTVGTAPTFTSANTASFQATIAGSFTVTASGSPTPSYSSNNLPSWASINATTGEITGTPPDTSGSPVTVTITATNGIPATQTLTLTILPAVVAPTITTQPANVSVNPGQTATFSVTASGTALNYQWSRNGVPIGGATESTLNVSNVQASVAGSYSVRVSNTAGAVTSSVVSLVVNTIPVVVQQPLSQTVLGGSSVTFSAAATGGSSFNYQWRKNGVQIFGAVGSTLTLTGVTASDSGVYDVLVSNGLGLVSSSLAQLQVVAAPVAPVITSQPSSRSVVAGGSVTLAVGASGAPAPSYQWRKNGSNLAGANTATYVVGGIQAGGTDSYDVVVSNSVGSVTSTAATVSGLARSFDGIYFGSFAGGLGNFALYVSDNNSGVFLGYLPGSNAPVMNLNFTINSSGSFVFSQSAIASSSAVSPNEGEPARAAALGTVVVNGAIGSGGSISGSISGGANAAMSGTQAPGLGATQNVAGVYLAGASSGAAVTYTIVAANSQAFTLAQSGNTFDGGNGSVTAAGSVSVVTGRSILSATISPTTGLVTGSASGAITASLTGANGDLIGNQRLVNISSRARVGSGDSVAIAGFVISGENSKPVLIRAVGPTLGGAPFNVAGALASPRLELFRGQTSLAVNTGIAGNRVAIDAAGAQVGAFTLGSSGADAAIITTLAPGAYTAVVSSTSAAAGVALVEVYDLSAPQPGQKLLNIATRASAGTADNTLIAGFVVPPGGVKRVLVRGVGPGLSQFGVAGVLAQPTLQLLSGSNTVSQNTNWSTSADRDAIAAASAQVGAFGLSNNDSAVIATLTPGAYTALVTGAGGATGVALIEVYELQ